MPFFMSVSKMNKMLANRFDSSETFGFALAHLAAPDRLLSTVVRVINFKILKKHKGIIFKILQPEEQGPRLTLWNLAKSKQ